MAGFVIIAPHADDELIGAYSLFMKGLVRGVYYLSDLGNLRLGEDYNIFQERIDLLNPVGKKCLLSDGEKVACLVPDVSDRHPLHRMVGAIGKYVFEHVGYYSTDMTAGYVRELPEYLQQEKRAVLNLYYPEKADLWENDHKYFLFEGVVYDLLTTTIKD